MPAKKAAKQKEESPAAADVEAEVKKETTLKPPAHEATADSVPHKKEITEEESKAQTAAAEKHKKPIIVPVKPPVFSKHKITRPEASKEVSPKAPLKPGEKIVGPRQTKQ